MKLTFVLMALNGATMVQVKEILNHGIKTRITSFLSDTQRWTWSCNWRAIWRLPKGQDTILSRRGDRVWKQPKWRPLWLHGASLCGSKKALCGDQQPRCGGLEGRTLLRLLCPPQIHRWTCESDHFHTFIILITGTDRLHP